MPANNALQTLRDDIEACKLIGSDTPAGKLVHIRLSEAEALIGIVDIAQKAIDHVIQRVRDHEYIGYYMGDLTESFELLTEAFATLHEVPLDFVQNQFRPKSPRKPKE